MMVLWFLAWMLRLKGWNQRADYFRPSSITSLFCCSFGHLVLLFSYAVVRSRYIMCHSYAYRNQAMAAAAVSPRTMIIQSEKEY
jgi:hypothetical protein